MSANTKIEWADHTFNPWIGCSKISPGCDHCYAELERATKALGVAWGSNQPRHRTAAGNWAQPKRWNSQADAFMAQHGRRQRVFCASLADVFDNEVPTEWRMDLFKLIADTPNLDWLILTKRIGTVMSMCSGDSLMFDVICDRVWLGATVVNQAEADRDIPKLLRVPAAKRFLSMEPLLGAVDIRKWLEPWTCADCEFHGSENDCGPDGCEKCGDQEAFGVEDVCKNCGADDQAAKPSCPQCGSHRSFQLDNGFKFDSERKLIDWVIVGGESGPGARPMHPDWARSLRDQCQAAGVPFLFKQWGEWGDAMKYPVHESFRWPQSLAEGDPTYSLKVGKKAAGRLLDGREWNGVPT